MSLSDRPGAYADCYKLFDAAIENTKGVRMPVSLSESEARYYQMRMNQARVVLRNESKRIYSSDHPLYNSSEYDGLQVRVRQDGKIWYIYVEPVGLIDMLEYIQPLDALPPPTPLLSKPSEPANAPDPEALE